MKFTVTLLLFTVINFSSLFAQRWSVGIGMLSDVSYSSKFKALTINDSVFIHAARAGVAYLDKPFKEAGMSININYLLLKRSSFSIESSLMYYKRYTQLQLRKIQNGFLTNYTLPVINASFLFQMQAVFNPIKRIKLSVGFGPSFHIKRKTISGYISNNPDLKEPYEQAQNIHRTITLNYSFTLEYLLSRRFSVLARHYSSVGNISKPFNIYDKSYNYALKWKSIGLSIQYKWSLNTN